MCIALEASVSLIGMVSVLRSRKGHRLFLETVPLILETVPHLRVLIVGDGPQRGNIERWIEERGLTDQIVMTGHREDIPDVLAALDVVVSASTAAEGVPQSLVQALAMERPVVATDVGGVREVIREGETGLLVKPHDPVALAESVLKLLANPGWAQTLACQGRKLVERSYSVDLMLDRLEALYQNLMVVASPEGLEKRSLL